MLNKAMNTMETIRKAEETRAALINEAREALHVLGATNEESTAIVNNNITINKGKIVKVEVMVEDKTLQDAYDKLAADLANRCERIEDLKDELETKDGIIEHQATTIAILKEQIAELEARVSAPVAPKFEVVDDPMYNEPEDTEEEVEVEESEPEVKGDDAVTLLPKVPEKYLADPDFAKEYNYWVSELNKTYEDIKLFGKVFSAEAQKQQTIKRANEVIAQLMEEIDNRESHNLNYNEIRTEKGLLTSVYGQITLANKEYAFKYDATFEKPVVYGCMDMALIDEARAILDSMVHFDRDITALGQKHTNQTIYDFENNIVVWVSDDGVFKGYTDKYAFVWDPEQAQPCGIVVKNALSNFRKYRKMNKSWGNGFVARAEFIMNYCRQIATNVVEDTNEVEVNFTNDNNDDNTVETMWDDFEI